MYCSHCGRHIQHDAKFCSYCGKPQMASTVGSEQNLQAASSFNAPLSEGSERRLDVWVKTLPELRRKLAEQEIQDWLSNYVTDEELERAKSLPSDMQIAKARAWRESQERAAAERRVRWQQQSYGNQPSLWDKATVRAAESAKWTAVDSVIYIVAFWVLVFVIGIISLWGWLGFWSLIGGLAGIIILAKLGNMAIDTGKRWPVHLLRLGVVLVFLFIVKLVAMQTGCS